MFYLEVVHWQDGTEYYTGQLCLTMTAVKETLANAAWIRFVIMELQVKQS